MLCVLVPAHCRELRSDSSASMAFNTGTASGFGNHMCESVVSVPEATRSSVRRVVLLQHTHRRERMDEALGAS